MFTTWSNSRLVKFETGQIWSLVKFQTGQIQNWSNLTSGQTPQVVKSGTWRFPLSGQIRHWSNSKLVKSDHWSNSKLVKFKTGQIWLVVKLPSGQIRSLIAVSPEVCRSPAQVVGAMYRIISNISWVSGVWSWKLVFYIDLFDLCIKPFSEFFPAKKLKKTQKNQNARFKWIQIPQTKSNFKKSPI